MGGMQVLQWAATYPERVFCAAADRRRRAPFLAEHRLPRGRPPGGDGRSGLARRPLSRAPARARARASPSPAWRRTSPTCPTTRCTASSAATCRIATSRPSASTPISRSRAICATRASTFVDRFDANSYLYLTRAMDYFDLAADHGGRLANAFKGTQTRFCVVSFTSDWLFPTVENKAVVRALNAAGGQRLASSRSRPTAATTPSCSTSRSCSPPSAASCPRPRHARGIGLSHERAVRPRSPRHVARDRPSRHRRAGGAGHARARRRLRRRQPARRCSKPTRGVDGRGIEISQKGVNECVARGLSVIQGDADTDLVDYPDDAFDFVILSPDAAGDAAARATSLEQMLRIGAARRSSPSRISAIGGSRADRCSDRPHAGDRATCPMPGTTRPTSTSAPSATSSRSATRSHAQIEKAHRAQRQAASASASMRRGGSGTCSASRRCSCLSR